MVLIHGFKVCVEGSPSHSQNPVSIFGDDLDDKTNKKRNTSSKRKKRSRSHKGRKDEARLFIFLLQ